MTRSPVFRTEQLGKVETAYDGAVVSSGQSGTLVKVLLTADASPLA